FSGLVQHYDRIRIQHFATNTSLSAVLVPYTPIFPVSSLCFFYSAGAHRHLHSFPTRRSSDLTFIFQIGRRFFPALFANWYGKKRSEEHTSELQSRFDLVCRLLLEKKNNEKAITSR